MPSDQTPTAASAWKADEPDLHTLPSGNTALLKRPSLMAMMRRGDIPNPLISAAVDMMDGKASQDYQATAELLAFMVATAFVEPRIAYDRDPGPDELPISALSDADQTYVIVWVNTAIPDAAPFPADGPGAEAGSDGRGIRDASE